MTNLIAVFLLLCAAAFGQDNCDDSFSRKENARNSELIFALRSRLLTPAEMAEVKRLGSTIYIVWWGCQGSTGMTDEQVNRRFNDDLLQQFQIRLAALEAKTKGCEK